MKIHVTGNAGSGKSTLAFQISQSMEFPLHPLDEIVWKENWIPTPADERDEKILQIVSKPCWVIDGVSKVAREHADFVVFIDRQPIQCAFRAFRRNIPYLFRPRSGLAKGCTEIRILPYLMKLIFRFNSLARPAILSDISEKQHVVLKTDEDVRCFLLNVVHNKLLHATSA